MGYDSWNEKVEQYSTEKEELCEEFELFSEEEIKVHDITSDVELFDMEIQETFLEIENEFDLEKSNIEAREDALEEIRTELTEEIHQELEKVNETKQKIEVLLGKKYTGNMETVSGELGDRQSELDYLLSQLDEMPTKSASSGVSGARDFATSSSRDNTSLIMGRYPTIAGEHSIEADVKAVNPNYSWTDSTSPWNDNCQRCVSAYEARRRGYDVVAKPTPPGADTLPYMRHPQGWPTVYQNGELIDCSANSGTSARMNIEEEMRTWGDGARAIVRVRWKPQCGSGGHVFIAECQNGKIRYVDPQVGMDDASTHFEMAKGSGVFCMRIDHLAFSDKIHLCCNERGN